MRKIAKHFKSPSYIKRGGVIIAFLLCLGSCKKNQDIAPKPNGENPAIVKRFLAHTSELPKNVQAIIKDLQTKQEAQPFITDFAQKNGFPDWQKTISVVSKSNMATKQAKTTVQPTTSKSDLFFVPLFGADSTQLLSYLVVYQYDERTFAYKNYNKNNLLANPKIKDEAFKPQIMGCFSPFTLWDSRFAEKLPAGTPIAPFIIGQKNKGEKSSECVTSVTIDVYYNADGETIISVTMMICGVGNVKFDIKIGSKPPKDPSETGDGGGGTLGEPPLPPIGTNTPTTTTPTTTGGSDPYYPSGNLPYDSGGTITQGGGQSPWWELPQGGPNGETPRPQIEQNPNSNGPIILDESLNNPKYEKVKRIVERMIRTQGFKKLTAFFDGKKIYQVKIKVGKIEGGATAATKGFEIILNEDKINKLTDIEIVLAFIHEVGHVFTNAKVIEEILKFLPGNTLPTLQTVFKAYFDKYPPYKYGGTPDKPNDSGDLDYPMHNYIAAELLNDMADAIQEYDKDPLYGKNYNNPYITLDIYQAFILKSLITGRTPGKRGTHDLYIKGYSDLSSDKEIEIENKWKALTDTYK